MAPLILCTLLAADAVWTSQTSGTSARLRGVSAAGPQVAWASGAAGTILRTDDGGATWRATPIDNAAALDFRDIDAVHARAAYALSIGPGEASRIYKTTDAGRTWQLLFTNREPQAFFDAIAFSSPRRGFAFSDSVNGRHILMRTDDGRTWKPVTNLPPARPNEGAFAASGTNIALRGRHIWIGTNAGRVLHSADDGRTWTATETGIASSPTAGIFSVAFRDQRNGIAVGGDYKQEGAAVDNAAVTSNGGRTWQLARGLTGFRSVVEYLGSRRVIAIGPNGTDLSEDGGHTWRRVADEGFHTFHLRWAAGENGRISRLAPGMLR